MKLKQAILRVMGRDVLKQAVNHLEIDDVDRRSVREMSARLSRARRATPEYLPGVFFLSRTSSTSASS